MSIKLTDEELAMIANPDELSEAELNMTQNEMTAHMAKVIAKSEALKKEAEKLQEWWDARHKAANDN
jgi:hypothetical protein